VTQSPSRLLVYRSHSLTSRNEQITTALIVVHGTGRNGNDYFRSGVAAGFLAQALDRTVVIAPRFASGSGVSGADGTECKDALAKGEASWVCESRSPHSWRSGGAETGTGKATSYDFMDEILRQLASRQSFPNLKAIVLAGHSAGGQFVTRYQMANRVHDSLGLPISYIVSNPSSYTYLDSLRPTVSSFPSSVASAAPGYQSPIPAKPPAPFVPFAEAASCTTYDNWPYGLKDRVGYAANIPDEQLRKQAAARPATYLLGDNDILPLGGFDSSCPARAQGPTRFARGLAFHKNLNERFGARHNVVIVPLCGHNNRCIYTSDVALPLLFPDAATASR
jgi:pimeloyl-ACP methyl ester carboxylesterase